METPFKSDYLFGYSQKIQSRLPGQIQGEREVSSQRMGSVPGVNKKPAIETGNESSAR